MWRWLMALAVVVFLLALGALMPATVLTSRIEARMSAVRFQGVSGTVWNGRASGLLVAQRDWGVLHWRVRPAGLLRGRLVADLNVAGAPADGNGHRFSGQVWMALSQRLGACDVDAQLPAEWLAPVFQNTGLVPGGVIDLQLAAVELDGRTPQAIDGRVLWRDAVVSGAARARLGDLIMEFALVQGRIIGEMADSGGPLALDGGFELGPTGYQLDAYLSPRDPALEPALSYLGQPDGQGGRYLAVRGGWLADWLERR